MDRRFFVLLSALVLLALVLASCSQVFEAGISGTVVTKDGTRDIAVPNVNVFAYTDKSLRDSDLAKFKAGSIKRPSEGSGYVASTTTNAQGEFVVNKIVWETKKSEFGKTADVNKLYLIFYNEDYTPTSYDATIISGSTNQSNVYMTLEGNKDYTTLEINVLNVASGYSMTDACTLKYTLNGKSDTVQVPSGRSTISVSYEKGTHPDVDFELTSPGTSWKMCDANGKVYADPYEPDPVNLGPGTRAVNLYMKNHEFTLPAFSGYVEFDDSEETITNNITSANGQDNLSVWLEFVPVTGGHEAFTETESRHKTIAEQTVTTSGILFHHGYFSGVGNEGYTVTINETNGYKNAIDWADYENEKTATIELLLVIERDTPALTKCYPFTYTLTSTPSELNIKYSDLEVYPPAP